LHTLFRAATCFLFIETLAHALKTGNTRGVAW